MEYYRFQKRLKAKSLKLKANTDLALYFLLWAFCFGLSACLPVLFLQIPYW